MKKIILLILFLIINYSLLITNCISQWTTQGVVDGVGPWPSISVYSPSGLIVAGGLSGSPKVFKSADSGVNWVNISGNLTGPELYCVWAVNENLIFVGDGGSNGGTGGNAKMWKTTNGGVNWSVVLTTGGTTGFFNGIVFSRTNPLIGIAQSDPTSSGANHYLAKTTDGGNTWFTQYTMASGGHAIGNTVVCIDNLFYGWGLTSAYGTRIMLTTDGGTTWNIRNSNISTGAYTSGLAFHNDKTKGIIAGAYTLPFIGRTTNGGINWSYTYTGLTMNSINFCRMKWVYGTDYCYLTSENGDSGCVAKSSNGGLNWSIMNTSDITNLLNIDLIYTGGVVYAYAVTVDGIIIRLEEPVVGIHKISNEVPAEFVLYQNYPNPFNPITKIKFDIPNNLSFQRKLESSNVSLKVFDIMGKELATLINEQLQPGTYEVTFDGSKLSSGIYFYKLTVGDYNEVKRMMLIK